MSSQGELSYDGREISVFDFLTQKSTKHTAQNNAPKDFGMSGHAGADYHLVETFISAVAVSACKKLFSIHSSHENFMLVPLAAYFHPMLRVSLFLFVKLEIKLG